MEDNIITLEGEKIYKEFEKSENRYGLIISMFSLERLWIPFTFATSQRTWDVQTKVRQCLDMMWNRISEGKTSVNGKAVFSKVLNAITNQYEEDDSKNIVYNYAFDNYLVNALYSNIKYFFDDPASEKYKVRTSASMAVFDLLSDYMVDITGVKNEQDYTKNIAEDELILAELERIAHDMVYTRNNLNNIEKINQLKEYYMNMEILPINTLELQVLNS